MLLAARGGNIAIPNPVLIDLPGWGDAALTSRGEDAALTSRGEDAAISAVCSLVKESAEALGYTEWDIVGHSMGGFIALHIVMSQDIGDSSASGHR
jgi:pimeloyl-ACP methyl ester carboxylesterase